MRRHTNRQDATRRIKGLATDLQSKLFPFLGLRYCWFIKGCSIASSVAPDHSLHRRRVSWLTKSQNRWAACPTSCRKLLRKYRLRQERHVVSNLESERDPPILNLTFAGTSGARFVLFAVYILMNVGQVYKRISCMNSRSPAEPYSARLWTDSLFWNNVIAQLSHVILRMTQSDVFR